MRMLAHLTSLPLRWIALIGISGYFLACQAPSSGSSAELSEATVAETTASALEEQVNGADSLPTEMGDSSAMRTRGLGMNARMGPFDFPSQFPVLYGLLQPDAANLALVSGFARSVLQPTQITSAEALEQLLVVQREKVKDILQAYIQNQDGIWQDENWQPLEQELNLLGLTQLSAEGTFIGLGKAPVLAEEVQQYASEALQLYLRFEYAYDQSANGEYPYMNMEPYQEMVQTGARLENLSPNPYFKLVEERFHQALVSMTDIHTVIDNSANQTVMVGGIHTEAYPYTTDLQSRGRFARQKEGAYTEVMAKIMANMSEMSINPEALYVIVTEWLPEEEIARSRVYRHLASGEDIPHVLEIKRPNGSTQYAVTYRFFEDPDKAETAMQTIEQVHPEAQLLMVSVRKGVMYQMEASMN